MSTEKFEYIEYLPGFSFPFEVDARVFRFIAGKNVDWKQFNNKLVFKLSHASPRQVKFTLIRFSIFHIYM